MVYDIARTIFDVLLNTQPSRLEIYKIVKTSIDNAKKFVNLINEQSVADKKMLYDIAKTIFYSLLKTDTSLSGIYKNVKNAVSNAKKFVELINE